MGHPRFPKGATGAELATVQRLHRVADLHREPEVRSALSDALDLIVELIEDRARRRSMADRWDGPHDGG